MITKSWFEVYKPFFELHLDYEMLGSNTILSPLLLIDYNYELVKYNSEIRIETLTKLYKKYMHNITINLSYR